MRCESESSALSARAFGIDDDEDRVQAERVCEREITRDRDRRWRRRAGRERLSLRTRNRPRARWERRARTAHSSPVASAAAGTSTRISAVATVIPAASRVRNATLIATATVARARTSEGAASVACASAAEPAMIPSALACAADRTSVNAGGGQPHRAHVARDADDRDDDVVDDDRNAEQRIDARAGERDDRLHGEQDQHDRPEPRDRLHRPAVHERSVGDRDDERGTSSSAPNAVVATSTGAPFRPCTIRPAAATSQTITSAHRPKYAPSSKRYDDIIARS